MHSERGQLAVVEGIDGSGKSTVTTELSKQESNVVSTFEPRDDMLPGFLVRKSIRNGDSDPFVNLCLYVADHVHHLNTVIRPALESNKIVLSDRYYHSRYVYQPLFVDSETKFTQLLAKVLNDLHTQTNQDDQGEIPLYGIQQPSDEFSRLLRDSVQILSSSASPVTAFLVRAAASVYETGSYIPVSDDCETRMNPPKETVLDSIIELHTTVNTVVPDKTILLDISPEISIQRTNDSDKFTEKEFLKMVRKDYKSVLNELDEETHVVNAEKSPDKVLDSVKSVLTD